jgi:hypothetical protein
MALRPLFRTRRALALTLLMCFGSPGLCKPIAFANGTTAMAEYGADTMIEVQAFYAPSFRYSIGGGHLRLRSDIDSSQRDITYVRLNYLPKRWNLESAQANIFVWGSLGGASTNVSAGEALAFNAGAQFDYETRRIYSSLRTDYHESTGFGHRIDTLQLGVAPYKHDFDTLAIWFVVQARQYTGGLHDGVEWAALLRFFKRGAWLEAGLTRTGQVQAMMMFNF